MVQYLPPPDPSLIFPQRRPGLGAEFTQGMAQGMGNWPQIFGEMYHRHKQQQEQQALISQLTQAFGGKAGKPASPAPTAGIGGMTQAPRQPMMGQNLSQIAPLLIQLGIQNPHLAPLLGRFMTSVFPKQAAPKPTETYYTDLKTGRPSLIPKPGYTPVQGKPGEGRMYASRWALSDLHEKDKQQAIETSRKMRQIKLDNDIMAKTRPLLMAKERYKRLVEARKALGDSSYVGSLEETGYSSHGLTGHLARAMLPAKVRSFLDMRTRSLGDIKGMTRGNVTQWELQVLPQGMFPSLNEPMGNVLVKQKDFNNKIDHEIAMIKAQAQLEHELLGVQDEARLQTMFGMRSPGGTGGAAPQTAEELAHMEVTP